MMRCRQYCGGAADSVHRQSTVDIQVVQGRWWFLLYVGPVCVCVPEACDVRIVIAAILEKKLVLMFGIHG